MICNSQIECPCNMTVLLIDVCMMNMHIMNHIVDAQYFQGGAGAKLHFSIENFD